VPSKPNRKKELFTRIEKNTIGMLKGELPMKYIIKAPDLMKYYVEAAHGTVQKRFKEPCWAVFNEKDALVVPDIEFGSVNSAMEYAIERYAVQEGIKQITIETKEGSKPK
jgi:hypothetical protein